MKRIVKVLAVAALMVVLMATIASPAFAQPNGNGRGYGPTPDYKYSGNGDCNFGWAYGSKNHAGYTYECK